MNKKILNTDIEERIKNIEKQVQKYNESSLQDKSTEKNTTFENNIKECLSRLDKLEQILVNPVSIKKGNTKFEKIRNEMEEIVNMDTSSGKISDFPEVIDKNAKRFVSTNKTPITEKIKTYLKLHKLLQLSEHHIKNNKIEEIIVE